MAKHDSPPDMNVWHALGLTPPAATSKNIDFTADQIRKAWRAASLHCHPDKLHQRYPGTQNAFPSMTQLNLARDFLLQGGNRIDELAYRVAVRKYATTAAKPFHPTLPIGDKGVFTSIDEEDSDLEEIRQEEFTPSSKSRSQKFGANFQEAYAESDQDMDYEDDGAQSDGSSNDSHGEGSPSTAKGRRGAGRSRGPRPAPYPERPKTSRASNTGTKKGNTPGTKKANTGTKKSKFTASTQTFPSAANLMDIAEPPKLSSIFVGWPKDHYDGAPMNKDNIPIVLGYFSPYGKLTMRVVGLTRENQIVPNITSIVIQPEDVVPNAHFINMSMVQVQNEVLRLMHIPVGRRPGTLGGLYFGGMAQS